jgi:hypothetical protein
MTQDTSRDQKSDGTNEPLENGVLPDEGTFDPAAATQELTAYLDGELPSEEASRIERRLNEDPKFLAEMQSLQRSWDVIDAVANDPVDDSFVRTTMEMIVADAQMIGVSSRLGRANRVKQPLLILLPAVLLVVSFLAARYVQSEPHRRLLQNLALIENLDRYRMINCDLVFLERLNQRDLFSQEDLFVGELDDLRNVVREIHKDTESLYHPDDDPETYLASLNRAQLQRLKLNYESFSKLPDSELARLTEFHEQIQSHAERDQLMTVLDAYYDWLVALGATEKASLLDLDTDKRLAKIAEIRFQQSKSALGREGATKLPLDRDEEYLLNWFDLTIKSHEAYIRRQFPDIVSSYQSEGDASTAIPREQLARFAQQAPVKQLVAVLMRVDRQFIQDLIYEDIDLLRRGMSYEAQLIISDQDFSNQKALVLNWIEAAHEAKATIPDEKLKEFYEQLPAEKRDQLDRMSIEEWTNTLRRMFRERNTLFRIEDIEDLFFGGF